jgi:acetyltransferase-like isoleucine patch superfamily enzyme
MVNDRYWNLCNRLGKSVQENGLRKTLIKGWSRFWMLFAGMSPFGRFAMWLASWPLKPYYGRIQLAYLKPSGYVSFSAKLSNDDLELGDHVYIGDGVLIYQDEDGGKVQLEDGVHLHCDIIIQTGQGGTVSIGPYTHIQPRCQFSAYMGSIRIGRDVEIAPNCAFFPYNHGVLPHEPIRCQPLQSKGDIVVEDEAWLGVGVIVLDGVRIGRGAVVGAGSVVTTDIPDGAIAAGSPARVIKMRSSLSQHSTSPVECIGRCS